ncbi:KTSC domain-containing protein [Mesorhizobium sp. WSM2239]|uniref:KTSC domain-containing protein n=2 Tax=unclassified Mesorhizobium TaxID=325217 RepID=A0AAU8DHT1_9HYPH
MAAVVASREARRGARGTCGIFRRGLTSPDLHLQKRDGSRGRRPGTSVGSEGWCVKPFANYDMPSTSIRKAEYDPVTRTLAVWFVASGKRYYYVNVPPEIYTAFRQSFARGKYSTRRSETGFRTARRGKHSSLAKAALVSGRAGTANCISDDQSGSSLAPPITPLPT